jgi:hypothetical protein
MTVHQLTATLSNEELIGWAAYFEMKQEYEEKAMERNKHRAQAGAMRSR